MGCRITDLTTIVKDVTIYSACSPNHFSIEGKKDQYFVNMIKLIENDVKSQVKWWKDNLTFVEEVKQLHFLKIYSKHPKMKRNLILKFCFLLVTVPMTLLMMTSSFKQQTTVILFETAVWTTLPNPNANHSILTNFNPKVTSNIIRALPRNFGKMTFQRNWEKRKWVMALSTCKMHS